MKPMPETLMMPLDTRTEQGGAQHLPAWCVDFGRRGVLVCGNSLVNSGGLDRILESSTADVGVRVWIHPGGEPTLTQLEDLLTLLREHEPDWVAAVGGGSVLDIAKAGAGLCHAPLPATAYHDGEPIPPSRIAFVAVPTTAGTGSEATMVSVLTNADTGVKKSIRHPSFMARLVLLDATLLATCPPDVLAASGMDALTQAMESYCSKGASWFTDAVALKALALVHGSLESAYGGDKNALTDLLTGSYLAGVALSNARLGLVHGLAHPLGARYHLPHGLVCAVCLSPVLAFNKQAIPDKYARMSEILGEDALYCVGGLLDKLNMHNPFAQRTLRDRDAVIAEALASGSTKANPRDVSAEDVAQILDTLFCSSSEA